MEIISNKEIDNKRFIEFIYTNFNDNTDKVYVDEKSTKDSISLKTGELEFKLPILFDYDRQRYAMYKAILLKKYNKRLNWGVLVGVRPTKLVNKMLEEGHSEEEIRNILSLVYLVKKEKIDLVFDIIKNDRGYIDKSTISLYVGLAFCPTKCTYCSFPAYLKKGKYEKKYDEYFLTIIDEVKEMTSLIKELRLKVGEIYIGGGTPSFLNYSELETLLSTLHNNVDFSTIKEFTFEAGRIDTLDEKKLDILKKYCVDRISINPQSFKEETLKKVNRYHSQEKLDEIYNLAYNKGFCINMDYIMGLPNESTEDMLNTIEKMKSYKAQNITIHSLALKKTSYLSKSKFFSENVDMDRVYKNIYSFAKEYDYLPYYIYRQKQSYREEENIGFCKKGYQSRYNIDIIEENKNIFSVGAGSYTKLIDKNNITRITAPKDPLVYVIEYRERIKKKKEEIKKFYEKNFTSSI